MCYCCSSDKQHAAHLCGLAGQTQCAEGNKHCSSLSGVFYLWKGDPHVPYTT